MKKNIFISLLLIVLIACKKEHKQYANKLERSLDLSGKNRTELEKVLIHYSKKDKDSLKYKAAIFLIKNMEGHSYRLIKQQKEWNNILELSNSLIKKESDNYKKIIDSSFKSVKFRYNFLEDLKQVKAKDLIENIDAAFNVWPKSWNAYLDFDGFCNYILPYRQKNEPLELNLRKKYYLMNRTVLKDSTSIKEMMEVAKKISFNSFNFKYNRLFPFDKSISDTEKSKMFDDCEGQAIHAVYKGRSIGIPMAIDFVIWPNARHSHYWGSIPYNKDSIIGTGDPISFIGTPGSYRTRRKIAKIYRLMFEAQDSINNIKKNNLTGTFLDKSNIKDVTSQYIETTNIKMKLRSINRKIFSTAFLCIFNNRKWKPVAKSSVNKDLEVHFKDVGKENIYTIFYIDGIKKIPAYEAFSLDKEGRIFKYKADIKKVRNVKLKRKTKLTNRIKHFGLKMAGGLFQLSNTPDFKNAKNVYLIPKYDTVILPRTIDIIPNKSFRYARYRSPINEPIQIAEMKWFSEKDTITGNIIGSKSLSNDENTKKVFDDNDLTFFEHKETKKSYTWIGLDFGNKKKISKLKFAPRSDLNYIKPTDIYELVYWDNEWISVGKKIAKDYHIHFDNVPKNGLLWLRNLSDGIEEELFIYENQKQHFWNSSEY